MKMIQEVKHIGQSWCQWFIASLIKTGFQHTGPNKYVLDKYEVRIFRNTKTYQVYIDGVKIADNLNFSFPHLTNVLWDDNYV